MALSLSLSLASAQPLAAQYSFVAGRAGIGGTGLINWSNAGSIPSSVTGPFAINVTGTALTATVSQVNPGNMQLLQQGTTALGNFTNGDPLLAVLDGPLDILFSGNVAAAGANFQNPIYGAFTGRIEAYDAAGLLLSGFDFAGLSTAANDGSAVFAGIASASGNIRRIRFATLTAAAGNPLVINNLSVNTSVDPSVSVPTLVAPEPGTYLLMATGLLFVAVAGAVRQRSHPA